MSSQIQRNPDLSDGDSKTTRINIQRNGGVDSIPGAFHGNGLFQQKDGNYKSEFNGNAI